MTVVRKPVEFREKSSVYERQLTYNFNKFQLFKMVYKM